MGKGSDRPLPGRGELSALVLRFMEAFNEDDLDGVMDFFAHDAIYITFDGNENRGRRAIRAAFEPQFRGDYGKIRFHTEDTILDESLGKAVLRWLCQHEIEEVRALPRLTQMKQMFYRGMYGRTFGWYGLDVIRFEGGLVREKYTYARARLPLVRRSPGDRF